MAVRHAVAHWEGGLKDGQGELWLESGAFEGPYSYDTRFKPDGGTVTNPEELLGAAHAGCVAMSLSRRLEEAGHPPKRLRTTAYVYLEKTGNGHAITRSHLKAEAEVPGIDEREFRKLATEAVEASFVSKALAGVKIDVEAHLLASAALEHHGSSVQ
jgi:osmotically inducible protein OsmC